jgi:hypothetical protein
MLFIRSFVSRERLREYVALFFRDFFDIIGKGLLKDISVSIGKAL